MAEDKNPAMGDDYPVRTVMDGAEMEKVRRGRPVSPPFPDHRAAPPQAGCIAPLIHLGAWSSFWGHFKVLFFLESRNIRQFRSVNCI